MFTVNNYIADIKTNLENQSGLLVRNLKDIFQYKLSPGIDLLDFSAFIDHTRFEISIRMFSMDKEANEVFYQGSDTTLFSGSVGVLSEVIFLHINESQLDAFFEFYEQNEETIVSQEKKVFIGWFSQCWEEAGVAAFNVPSYFVFQDDNKSYDLRSTEWIDDDEKWS